MLSLTQEPDGTTRWTGTLHETPVDLRVEPDPEYPPFWRWVRFEGERLRSLQTCVSRDEAIRQAFDWLKILRDGD
jgi:hypothetical protein